LICRIFCGKPVSTFPENALVKKALARPRPDRAAGQPDVGEHVIVEIPVCAQASPLRRLPPPLGQDCDHPATGDSDDSARGPPGSIADADRISFRLDDRHDVSPVPLLSVGVVTRRSCKGSADANLEDRLEKFVIFA
jgi:hypothetical protein